jgi:hypothetical protein
MQPDINDTYVCVKCKYTLYLLLHTHQRLVSHGDTDCSLVQFISADDVLQCAHEPPQQR